MVWKLSMSRLASVPRIGAAAISIVAAAVFCSLELSGNPSGQFPNPPQLLAKHHTLSFTLHAGVTKDGKNSFYFDGQPIAPTLRLSPGDQLKINYINDLPARPQETCAITPCMDMTNLHFHGLTVSPDAPQDDVLDMMAMPGQSLRYTVQIPQDHPPGLYWYHTHPHGESHRQVLDGMSGSILHDPKHRTSSAEHVLLPPAGRLEATVTGPSVGTARLLISRCVDTGPDGDPNPAMVLADIVPWSTANSLAKAAKSSLKPEFKTLDLAAAEKAPPRFTVTFTEDKNGFYINGKKFPPAEAPM